MRSLTFPALIAAIALVAGSATASSDYPDIVRERFGLARPPDCVLCHSDDKGGNGTIVTWFGLAMQDFGLQGKRPDLLYAALDKIQNEDWDSDGDDIPDVEELKTGSDPNDGPGRTGGPPRPGRGCAVVFSVERSAHWDILLLVGLSTRTAFAWWRRHRGRGSRGCPASAKGRSSP